MQNIVEMLLEHTQVLRQPLEKAARDIRRVGAARADVDEAVRIIREMQEENSVVVDTVVGPGPRTDRWYTGPRANGQWARYRDKWIESGKPGLDYLDDSTSRITGLLANPAAVGTRKGLVMGNVQSGKTGNFAGVIAKAVDAGYRVVIVLAGIYNNLRAQTQLRLEHDVFGDDWDLLTDDICDLGVVRHPVRQLRTTRMTALVVKKNPKRLENLRNALRDLPEEHRRKLPILIIDDEADQATPNTPTKQVEVSTINRLMREIWEEVQVGSYVAYTATPFANVLMNADDEKELFPSDFITSLKPGPTYFGAERVFGIAEGVDDSGEQRYADGLDMVRSVPDTDLKELKPPSNKELREEFVPPIVDSLADALRWFIIATAVRRLRGDTGHSSMLVHTTHYAAPHMAMRGQVEKWIQQEIANCVLSKYKKLWNMEHNRVVAGEPSPAHEWQAVAALVEPVLQSAKVIVDNGLSEDRLDYTKEDGQTVIAIGGGTLARGLTLEGLVVSYFTRSTNTYDTLMQMGRWFGYRGGYEDLPRIWVSDGLDKDYAFLARVERDLREEIESIEGTEFTPQQVGVKVRHHPGRLEITSVGRMKNAKVVQISLGGTMRQSFILDGSADVQEHNRHVIERLLGPGVRRGRNDRLETRGVSSSQVNTFLRDFQAHESQRILQSPDQLAAIETWLGDFGRDAEWTVIVANNSERGAKERLGSTRIAGHEVTMSSRAPLNGSRLDELNFKAVMSPGDWVADIDPKDFNGPVPSTGAGRRRARRELAHGKGLVVVYPISPNSAPAEGSASRMPIPVNHPVYAFAIFFPTITDREGQEGDFVSVRPNPMAVSEEYVEEEIIDTEDSHADPE